MSDLTVGESGGTHTDGRQKDLDITTGDQL